LKTFDVRIVGKTPLLMHFDNIEWADEMGRWKDNPENRKGSVAGDDRSPAWRWIGCLYNDGAQVTIPSENLMRCLMEGGAMVPVPKGKNGKTFKAQTQSGCNLAEPHWPLLVAGQPVPMAEIHALLRQEDFQAHQATAARLGFDLLVKRAKVGTSKHGRVRPRFAEWSARGLINAWDEQLTLDVLQKVFTFAGQYKGLGDWRPGGKTPGSFGMFSATVTEVS
jgi:hypothetical protein